MTAATGRIAGIKVFAPLADEGGLKFSLAANVVPFRNWFLTISPTTGYMSQALANVPGQIAAGFADRDSDGSTTAGRAAMIGRWSFVSGFTNSTGASDSILSTDVAVPFWFVDNQTVGKLSNLAGSNRTLGGIALGIDEDPVNGDTPIIWCNPVAQLLARATLVSNAIVLASHNYAVDAGAATDLTETIFNVARAKLHGTITSIEFIANATLAATGGTDFKTLTVTKYAADGTTPVVVGTMTTVLVTTKWVAKAFALSAVAGALDILEGDIFTIQNSHGGTGAVTPAGVLRVNGKAL